MTSIKIRTYEDGLYRALAIASIYGVGSKTKAVQAIKQEIVNECLRKEVSGNSPAREGSAKEFLLPLFFAAVTLLALGRLYWEILS